MGKSRSVWNRITIFSCLTTCGGDMFSRFWEVVTCTVNRSAFDGTVFAFLSDVPRPAKSWTCLTILYERRKKSKYENAMGTRHFSLIARWRWYATQIFTQPEVALFTC